MKLDIVRLQDYVEKKLISKRKHPLIDLYIYNYTQACSFDKLWDKNTEMSRGLILDADGNVIARPFPKFWNVGELPKTELQNLPQYQPEVSEKLDGSLGILFHGGTDISIATRGSFESDQSLWATNWIREHRPKDKFLEDHTYLWEILYKNNRIVLNYGDREECVLIGLVYTPTGKIMPYDKVKEEAKRLGYSYPKKFNLSIDELQKRAEVSTDDEEGFVLFYPEENLQVKIKVKDYIRLHRLIFGVNARRIWDLLRNKQSINELLESVPAEFADWVKETVKDLTKQYNIIDHICLQCWEKLKSLPTRKEQAIEVFKKDKDISGVIFKMLDNKPYDELIWKMIRPAHETPFKMEI